MFRRRYIVFVIWEIHAPTQPKIDCLELLGPGTRPPRLPWTVPNPLLLHHIGYVAHRRI